MAWPETADGDVFRRLEASGFDFSASHVVEYNVDFHTWPPAEAAIALLRSNFAQVSMHESQDGNSSYVQFREAVLVKYERVISVQEIATAAMAPFGGICDSWGIFH